MKKYFVISDIHGFYEPMKKALDEKGFNVNNPNHILISCGDMFDRGPDSIKMMNFLLGLYYENRAILIRGNHEDLMEEAICRGYFKGHDISNRTTITACDLTGKDDPDEALQAMKDNDFWNRYINACIDYYEVDDYIFVHGWIPVDYEIVNDGFEDLPFFYRPDVPCYRRNWREAETFEWEEARWFNGMRMCNLDIKEPDKTIVCGHYHTSWGHSHLHDDGVEYIKDVETYYIDPETGKQEPHANFDIFYDDGIIAIDACTALTNKVNVLVIGDDVED